MMNDRLEIASRLLAGSLGSSHCCGLNSGDLMKPAANALKAADLLIALDRNDFCDDPKCGHLALAHVEGYCMAMVDQDSSCTCSGYKVPGGGK